MGEIDRHCGFINHFNINGYGVSRENNVELYRLGHRAINIYLLSFKLLLCWLHSLTPVT